MTAREYLNQPRELDRTINRKLRLLESYRDLAQNVSSPKLSEKVQEPISVDAPFIRYLEKADELQKEIDADIDRLVDLKIQMCSQIDKVEDINQSIVLIYKYLQLLTWEEISNKMRYSVRWVQKIHAQALESFEEVMNNGLL